MKSQPVMKVVGEGGAHLHKLQKTLTRTDEDGFHKHLFFVNDRLLMTDLSGAHSHSVNAKANSIGAAEPHMHMITINTQEGMVVLETDSESGHSHELQSTTTTLSGLHLHTLDLGGQQYISLLPGDLLEAVEEEAKREKSLKDFKIQKSDDPMEVNFSLVKRLNREDFKEVLRKAVFKTITKGLARLREGLQVESLILSRERFFDLGAATRFVLDSGLAINGADERDESFVFNIRIRSRFDESSLQRISITDGVEAVVGLYKEEDEDEKQDGGDMRTSDDINQLTDRNKLKARFAALVEDGDDFTPTTKRDDGKTDKRKFINWKTDKVVTGTCHERITQIANKHSIKRKFVTIEPAERRYVAYITEKYEMVSAVHRNSSQKGVRDEFENNFKNFYAKTDGVDAFLIEAGAWGQDLVLFFDEVEELDEIFHTKIENYKHGAYEFKQTMAGPVLLPMSVDKNAKPILDEELLASLKRDTKQFFNKETEEFFKANEHLGLVYKRGIFLHGPPGNGKTTFIKYFVTEHMKSAYSIYCEPSHFSGDMGKFLQDRLGEEVKKAIVFEDIDAICYNYASRSALLNFLDGPEVMSKTLFIATSNYPGRLDDALTKRPSRFDQKYKIDLPNNKMRQKFLKFFFPKLSQGELVSFSERTKGFSGAYFKELFILKNLQKCTLSKVIDILQAQISDISKKFDVESVMDKETLTDVLCKADKEVIERRFLKYESLDDYADNMRSLHSRFSALLGEDEEDEEQDTETQKTEIRFDIVKRDNEKRIVLGPVLIPENVDLQDDIVSADEIEKTSHNYMIKLNFRDDPTFLKKLGLNRKSKRGFMHVEFNRRIALVESYIAPVDFELPISKNKTRKITKGTWVMAVKVFDDEVWNLVKAGRITGFSIGGRSRSIQEPDD